MLQTNEQIRNQGRRAFMLGGGPMWTERGIGTLEAENPFKDEDSQRLWDAGYREARETWYQNSRRTNGKVN